MSTNNDHINRAPRSARRKLAAVLFAGAITAGVGVVADQPVEAAVSTSTGAYADTVMWCNRALGAYSVGSIGSGFEWAQAWELNSVTGEWRYLTNGWVRPSQLANLGQGLRSRGQVAVYVHYVDWNGSSWTHRYEWARITNGSGQTVGYWC